MAYSGTPADLLKTVYEELEFDQGRLLEAASEPTTDDADWNSVGEWLMLAHRMGAERVFFVGDDPVIVFKKLPASAGEAEILRAYRSAWSLARPHCLFLSTTDGLHVYALTAPPTPVIDEEHKLEPLEIVLRAADVAEILSRYHRERIESGILFEEQPFNSRDGRADTQLLRDVRAANMALVNEGLPPTVAHALIERVILVRYLEDRKIITSDYLTEIAKGNEQWLNALKFAPDTPQFGARSAFVSCLVNRDFAYSVFDNLEADFNGDLFRVGDDEQKLVGTDHLELIRSLLMGGGLDPETPLFLWAYDFDIVPTSLISSMYEQFYRSGNEDDRGTHYTPPELVEYILSRVLSDDVLSLKPRICDPACGSGIFLVEAFRRLVRHSSADKRRTLTSHELQDLLLNQVAGVDLNQEAIRLAAFSLYLAYLNYQDPSDIQVAGPLPRLIHRPGMTNAHPVLIVADAFAPTQDEECDQSVVGLPWASKTFDIVVGNPPWSEPRGSSVQMGDEWAHRNELPVGNRNPSQLFLWRSLSFVTSTGKVALLINVNALLNARNSSRQFRRHWLQEVELQEVVDFTSSRALFFEASIAPFALLVFRPRSSGDLPSSLGIFSYKTVRPSKPLRATGALAHAQLERRWVNQGALVGRDYLWKTYAWGNHHDEALMSRLDSERRLEEFLPSDPGPGFGFQPGKSTLPEILRSRRTLQCFDYWGPLSDSVYEEPPTGVKRKPDGRRYNGQRIIIAQGVRSGFGPVARLETEPFSFRHTVYCLPLHGVAEWKAKTILGTLLSSLGRYRLFMTSGSWGVWHDTFRASQILALPTRLPTLPTRVTKQISQIIERLVDINKPRIPDRLFDNGRVSVARQVEDVLADLDDAVFELFDANEAERDLVSDFMNYTLPLVGNRTKWLKQPTVEIGERRQGTMNDLEQSRAESQLDRYLIVFLQRWNRELAPDGEFSWFAAVSPHSPYMAVVFETRERGGSAPRGQDSDSERWQSALRRLDNALATQVTASIRMNGTLRSVGEYSIVLAKRNEARLWTASAAREDAEATLLQAMNLQSTR